MSGFVPFLGERVLAQTGVKLSLKLPERKVSLDLSVLDFSHLLGRKALSRLAG